MTRIRFLSYGIWNHAIMIRRLGQWIQLSNGRMVERARCFYHGGVLDGQGV